MTFNPFATLTSKIFGAASIALAIACAVCWLGWDHAAGQRDKVKADYAAFRAASATAAKAALDRADAIKERKEHQYALAASQADRRYADLRARYLDALRLRQSTGSGGDRMPASAESHGAGLPEAGAAGRGLPDGWIAIQMSDGEKCALATAYAQGAYDWVQILAPDTP